MRRSHLRTNPPFARTTHTATSVDVTILFTHCTPVTHKSIVKEPSCAHGTTANWTVPKLVSTEDRPGRRVDKLKAVPFGKEFSPGQAYRLPSRTYSTGTIFRTRVEKARLKDTAERYRPFKMNQPLYGSQPYPHVQVDCLCANNPVGNPHAFIKHTSLMRGFKMFHNRQQRGNKRPDTARRRLAAVHCMRKRMLVQRFYR